MANILGLNFGHDAAVCILKNGKLAAAINKERLSRQKHDSDVTLEQINYVLDAAELSLKDITHVAFSAYLYSPQNEIKIFGQDGNEICNHLLDLPGPTTGQPYTVRIGERLIPGAFIHHHMAHAAAAFFTSPFERAACFTVDASMQRPEVCSLFSYGEGNKLHYGYCPGLMVGNAYNVFTEKLGIGSGLEKAGSTMGLAPYGKVNQVALAKWESYAQSYYDRPFQENDLIFISKMWSELSGMPPHASMSREESFSQKAMDIAASLQHVFERALVQYTNKLHEFTRSYNDNNLCLAGGSFLNCNANMKIREETQFENIHLFPACGDDGLCVGSALYLYHSLLNQPRHTYENREFMYLGKGYSNGPQGGVAYDPEVVAQTLANGGLVAWYQGRSEYGPRALGNRSLLGDPRNPKMREVINEKIKCREWYRPFAPVVLEEHAADWFEINFASPLMLFIGQVKQPEIIPAVTHVDQSARVQTIERSDNPAYYELVETFGELTGVPVLLNTSLNVNGEPIVETPEEALRFFVNTKVDVLVINGEMWLAEDRETMARQIETAA